MCCLHAFIVCNGSAHARPLMITRPRPRSVSTVPFAGADCQAVQFIAEPFHPSFRATCRTNRFFRAVALELDLSADGASWVSSGAVKTLNSDFVPTLATLKAKKCSLRSVPLAKPLVRCRVGTCNAGTRRLDRARVHVAVSTPEEDKCERQVSNQRQVSAFHAELVRTRVRVMN
jgi:hypothetical protein